jgi:hypothetical protein
MALDEGAEIVRIREWTRVHEVAEEAIQVVVLPIAEVGSPWCYAALYRHIQVSVIELDSPTDDIERLISVVPEKGGCKRDLFREGVGHR